uniref:Cytochrome c oxidase subunit 2 n=8 Tax=Anax TaxID=39259 RepID=A0A7M4BJA5_ANAPR|nr:cytochrome c oxidase subunit II [Anax imperator]YP_009942418.1 cytochrome c oxidase subunit II [Anax parthenope]AOW43651.1 cytochrome c oxidase subunit 2 [Anax imperator]QOC71587.1 cytochrome c oxidase subunit II [Anax parthenope]QOQ35054.1 cytochrome c oxidase subunit II [Anax parthenope]
MATWAQLNFQDAASPMMEQMSYFHDHTMMVLVIITMLVAYVMLSMFWNKNVNRNLLDGQQIETAWTVLPVFVLIIIAMPSLRLLYLLDEVSDPSITLKTVGHQWYWSYEYSDFNQVEFDSYMIPYNEMSENGFRLLEVDNRAVLPLQTQVRVLITAADVLHSWTVPSLGVKVDATPGRLNQASFFITRPGLFFGQCSEICGANHSFMPIVIESVTSKTFINWIQKMSEA